MFRKLAGLTAIAGLFFAGSALAQSAIDGTAHDFAAAGWNTTGEVCIVCHTTHNSDTTVSASPLWNHEVSQQTFALYSSATLDATDMGQPSGISLLCLSCHDGATALDSFGGAVGSTVMTSGAAVGGDVDELANDHPISFTYDTALAGNDSGLKNPSVAQSGINGTNTVAQDMLFAGKMECGSCHDVHSNPLDNSHLIKDNADSALCSTCHNQ